MAKTKMLGDKLGWQPEVASKPISALWFAYEIEAELVEILWLLAEPSGMTENTFINSIGFTLRMYGVTDGWGSIK